MILQKTEPYKVWWLENAKHYNKIKFLKYIRNLKLCGVCQREEDLRAYRGL